jgi:flagellar hook-associated protein 2
MGNGSGIDIRKLARDLTDVEKAPRESKLNTNIEDSEAKISGLAVLKFNVQLLIDAFNELNDAQELAKPTATSSDVTKVSVLSTDGSALSGIYDFAVSALASEQRNISNAYSSKTQALNGGSGFTLTVTKPVGGTATNIAIEAGNDNPEGVVKAINAAGLGVTAILVAADSAGSAYRIALQGETGASNSYAISSTLSDSDLGFHDASNGNAADNSGTLSLQNPGDASLTYNGVGLTRSTNVISDVLPGITVSLNGTTSGSDTVNLNVVSDRATLKSTLQDMVKLYNDVKFALDELSNPDSEEDEVGGSLAKDLATIRTVRDTIYQAVTQDSSTPSGNVSALRDIGVSVTRDGSLSFTESTYDTVAASNFDDISVMLSAGTNNQSRYDGQSQGLATDAVIKLETLTDSISGIFVTRTDSAKTAITRYQADLESLEKRMEAVYERYLQQFTVMESLVNTLNSTRESMSTTWENMGNFNKK